MRVAGKVCVSTYLEIVVTSVESFNEVSTFSRLVVVEAFFREPVVDESEDVSSLDFKTESNVLSNHCEFLRESIAVHIWDSAAGQCVSSSNLCQLVAPIL